MKFIETLRDGEQVRGIYLCKQKNSAVTKTGKPYDNIILQDKTGCIDGKIWDPHSGGIMDFEALDYVDVSAEVITFNGALQMNVRSLRKAQEGEYEPADYLPSSTKNVDKMYDELLHLADSVRNSHLNSY